MLVTAGNFRLSSGDLSNVVTNKTSVGSRVWTDWHGFIICLILTMQGTCVKTLVGNFKA